MFGRKIEKNILHGKSILNISFQVFIFDKRILQMAFTFEQKLAPIFLIKAYFSKDKIERLKCYHIFNCFYVFLSKPNKTF